MTRDIRVENGDDVLLASSAACDLCRQLGAGNPTVSRLDVVTRELAWNLVHHAGGGWIRLRGLRERARHGMLLESQDVGNGIGQMRMEEGRHGRSSLGVGLSMVHRNCTEFTLRTGPDRGTNIQAVLWWPSTST